MNYRFILVLALALLTVVRTGTFSFRHHHQNYKTSSSINAHKGQRSDANPFHNDSFSSVTSMNKIFLSHSGLPIPNYFDHDPEYFDHDKILFLNFSSPPFRPPC